MIGIANKKITKRRYIKCLADGVGLELLTDINHGRNGLLKTQSEF